MERQRRLTRQPQYSTTYKQALDNWERSILMGRIAAFGGNQSAAAESLEVDSRWLSKKLMRLGVTSDELAALKEPTVSASEWGRYQKYLAGKKQPSQPSLFEQKEAACQPI